MSDIKKERSIHELFDLTLFLKGAHATIELVGGLFLYIVSVENITNTVNFFLGGEITEDSNGIIAHYFAAVLKGLGGNSKSFVALYLVSHGIINGLMVLALWKEKLWAYPISFVVLGGFTIYQLYLLTFGYSLWLIILTLADLLIIYLVWHEYGVLKKRKNI